MKRVTLFLILASIFCLNACTQSDDFKYAEYKTLPLNEVKPTGWIAKQMKRDLDVGLTGHFDKFGKTVTYDLFVNKNRTSGKYYDGLKCWWSGEHEGYWKEGMLRCAFLTNHDEFKAQASKWVEDILSSTDESGYIGIYDNQSRYYHKGENGELWATSRIMMPLIAYYEHSGDSKVLHAIEKSVQQTMLAYADSTAWAKGEGGVAHGIGYFEVLEWLYRTTQNKDYADFSVQLYDDFCERDIRDDDLKTEHLLDADRKFIRHGAHIAEGFLVPQYIASITKNDTLQMAANLALTKLAYHTTPSGAMVCAENVKKKKGSGDEYYEYCATTEFINPLGVILSNTANYTIADQIEKMVFNALQGGRLPNLKALSYITADNRLYMEPHEHGARETYDAYHKAAACCALNGSRVMPYYVQHMWKKDHSDQSLIAMMYGPCEINTNVAQTKVQVVEETYYPFSDEVTFKMTLEKAKKFDFILRKPHGCESVEIKGIDEKYTQELDDRIIISNKWEKENSFTVVFKHEVKQKKDNYKIYLQRGPLVFAMPFPHRADTLRTHGETEFHQLLMHVTDSTGANYTLSPNSKFEYRKTDNTNFDFPFDAPLVSLHGNMISTDGKNRKVELVPLGNTIMRKTSFKKQ